MAEMLLPLLTSMMLAGCIKQVPTQPSLDSDTPAPSLPSEEAVTAALQAQRGLVAMEGFFKLSVTRNGHKNRLEGHFLAQSPDKLRLELLPLLGPPLVYATLRSDQARIYLPYGQDAVYQSDSPQRLIHQLTGGIWGLEDLVGALLGQAPSCVSPGPLEAGDEDGLLVRPCLIRAEVAYRLLIQRDPVRVVGLETPSATGDSPAFQITYGAFQPIDQSWLPKEIQLSSSAGLDLELLYTEILAREGIEDSRFSLEAPGEAQRFPLEVLLNRAFEGL